MTKHLQGSFPDKRPLYARQDLRADLSAGLAVSLVAIPQALAYAQLAGLPPHVGLYASLIPSLVGALFGASAQLNTGPVALTSLLTATALAPLAPAGSDNYLQLALGLALLAGLLQLGMGLLKLAYFAELLSRPVLHGFINACSLLICISQLPPLLGLPLAGQQNVLDTMLAIISLLPAAHGPSVLLGGLAWLLLVVLKRYWPRLPGLLIVVVGMSVLAGFMDFADQGGRSVGPLPAALISLALPELSWPQLTALLPSALVLALVSFLEAMSSCKLAAARTGERWNGNRELIGQGLAKISAGFCQAYPVSGSFGRSAVLLTQGARTRLASIFGVLLVLLALALLPDAIARIPRPVLAAVILATLSSLLDFRPLRDAWKISRDDGLAGTLSFVGTLAFAPHIEMGILGGLLLSLALLIYRSMRPRIARLGRHPDGTWRDAHRFGLAEPHPALVILRFDGALNFVTCAALEDAVLEVEREQPGVRILLLSGGGINEMDSSGVETLRRLQHQWAAQERLLACCGLKKQVIEALERAGLWATLAPHGSYRHEDQALAALQAQLPSTHTQPPRQGLVW